ncbi:type III-B CRISPR module RAMP protein Cmr1 [Persephonella sp.]
MSKKEIKVKLNTITPLWTGDAWQDNRKIRPSSLMGSLRFWFEVICYFSEICNKKDLNNGRFEKEVDRKNFRNCLVDKGNSFEAKIKCLLEQGIPWPSIVFGTTNWKSLIRIKEIKYLDDYCFGNKLNLQDRICINKSNYEIKENGDCPRRSNEDWSVFYFFNPYFYGKFKVKFEVEEEIVESIFYPLLNFMDKYGFWGGKWNLGYGRLEVLNNDDNWKKEEFIFLKLINSELEEERKNFSDFIQDINNFNLLTNINDKKIKVLQENMSNNTNLKELIKELIKRKSQERTNFRGTDELRHKIFGTTEQPPNNKNLLPQGTKILPHIYRENNSFRGGFISIIDLLTLEGENNGSI